MWFERLDKFLDWSVSLAHRASPKHTSGGASGGCRPMAQTPQATSYVASGAPTLGCASERKHSTPQKVPWMYSCRRPTSSLQEQVQGQGAMGAGGSVVGAQGFTMQTCCHCPL